VLLIVHGHSSHNQSLATIETACKHGVVMLSLPPHGTPLDVTFFKPLNTYMRSAITTKLRDKPGQWLSTEHIVSLVGMAFQRAATMEWIILYRSILLHCVHIWYIHLLLPCSRATFYRRCLKFNYKYNMNFKTLKLYYKSCRPHYMFQPIWPSSGVKVMLKLH
jgi:hypothetical protein